MENHRRWGAALSRSHALAMDDAKAAVDDFWTEVMEEELAKCQ